MAIVAGGAESGMTAQGERQQAPEVDPRAFRDVMGRFATGVTVITFESAGEPRGMTANAFSSVSLDPPLLLVCVAKGSSTHAAMEGVDAFAVNILSEEQQHLASGFARRELQPDTARAVAFGSGTLGTPIIRDALATAECSVFARYDGGDHTIFLGRVVELGSSDDPARPLLFYSGKYRALEAHTEV